MYKESGESQGETTGRVDTETEKVSVRQTAYPLLLPYTRPPPQDIAILNKDTSVKFTPSGREISFTQYANDKRA